MLNSTGVDMCIRDDEGQLLLAKTLWSQPYAPPKMDKLLDYFMPLI